MSIAGGLARLLWIRNPHTNRAPRAGSDSAVTYRLLVSNLAIGSKLLMGLSSLGT